MERKADFSWILHLSQVKGTVHQIVPFTAGRSRLLEVYQGSQKENWFLVELSNHLNLLGQYRGGITFIRKILEKMQSPCKDLLNLLTNPEEIEQFLKFDVGCELVQYILETYPDRASSIVGVVINVSEDQYSDGYKKLVSCIVQNYKDTRLLDRAFRLDYTRRPGSCQILAEIVRHTSPENWAGLVHEFVAEPAAYFNDQRYMVVIEAILDCGSPDQKKRISSEILDADFTNMPGICKFVSSMLSSMRKEEVSNLAAAISTCLNSVEDPSPELSEFVITLIWALPAVHRKPFINANKEKLLKMREKDILEVLAYLEYLENSEILPK